jgi:NDP-sugar pyrophosphorylase family protein
MPRAIHDAVILAAGRGTRMYPMTEVIPKPMVPFRGGTLISHGIAALKRLGLRIHITVGYKRAALAQHVMELGVDTVLNTEGHSNAWFLYHSLLADLRGPLLVLTCDNITEIDLELVSREYAALGEPACMLVPVSPVPSVDGDYIRQEQRVVLELSRTKVAETYCSGIQVVDPAELRAGAPLEGDFNAVWEQLIARRALLASAVYPHAWMSVDTIDAVLRAEAAGP